VGPGVTSLKKGDHVIPLYTPGVPRVRILPQPEDQPLPGDPLDPGPGPDAGRHQPVFLQGRADPALHGHSTFRQPHGAAGNRAGQGQPEDAPFDKICYIGCGVTTGIGAVINTAKVEIGSNVVVFGLGGIGLNVIQGLARLVGANMIVGVDVNDSKKSGAEVRHDPLRQPEKVDGDLVAHLVELTGGGADYSFECVGNVKLMRMALECAHKGWGESIIIGVAGAGQEISTRPFQLVTGRSWRGTAFGGARGRTDVPKIVDWYMDGKIDIDPMITHTLPLEDINKGFDLMHEGKSIRQQTSSCDHGQVGAATGGLTRKATPAIALPAGISKSGDAQHHRQHRRRQAGKTPRPQRPH
jgi:S-(hydroxymethyl)glutathione dehydrogenase/alcohol dehydrogenase